MQQHTLLITYLRPHRRRLLLLALLLLGGIGLELWAPQLIRQFLDQAGAAAPLPALLTTAVSYLLIVVLQQGLSLATAYAGEDLGWQATNRLRGDLVAHVLALDIRFHKEHTPGELIERVDGDVRQLAQYFTLLVITIGGNGLLAIGIVVLLWREGGRFAAVGAAYFLGVLLFLHLFQPLTTRLWARRRQANADYVGFLEERLLATEDIRANGAEGHIMHGLGRVVAPIMRSEIATNILSPAVFGGASLIFAVSRIAVLALAVPRFLAGDMTIGAVYLVYAYVDLLERPLSAIRHQVVRFQETLASIRRIEAIRAERPTLQTRQVGGGPVGLPVGPLSVAYDHVSFTYETWSGNGVAVAEESRGQRPAATLQGIDFTLAPGRVLGVLGRTGSGKTTLTRLLFHLYDVDSGAIRIDGRDVRDIDPAELQHRVALVTQDVQIFAATIRDNLTFFQPQTGESDRRLHAVLDEVGLANWLARQPHGLDTRLQTGGQGLSAGEAQLLALARAFLRDPGIVILDEASSRLDPATAALLEQAIDRLLAGRTAILIAHRLHTVERADELLILKSGRIVEHGDRATLAADPHSRFNELKRAGVTAVPI